jgi:hypothetical protein
MKSIKVLSTIFVVLLLLVAIVAPVAANPIPEKQAVSLEVSQQTQEISTDLAGIAQDAVSGIPLIFVVLGLVALFKKAGVKGNKLLLISMAIGILFGSGYMICQRRPPSGDWYILFVYFFGVLVYGILEGLIASGIYDIGKGFFTQISDKLKE